MIDSSDAPTVGRATELGELDAALEALAAGGAGCVAVDGEAGIGKTHLLAELRRRAEEQGCLVLGGSATEFERDLPFSVWVDALDAYVASQELDLGDWDDGSVAELSGVVPSVRRAGVAAPSVADERYRSHRALRRLLELLAAERPLVVVLDDLHWSDGASVELIAALLRRGPDAPVLLALAFRRGQAAPRLSAALAVPSVRRLTLEHLSEVEATELLRDLDPKAAAAIYRSGGGNPFYLEQLARAGDDRAPAAGGLDAAGVPAAVTASLAEELASLAGGERALLEAAAVAGEPFEPDLAAAICEVPVTDALTALDALLALDLVRPTAVPRRFVFRHPLVRRAVYESAPGGWRLGAHARAADALAARGAAPAERAHHVEQSAKQGDEAAIAVMLDAGAAAAARAPGAAARWFEAALRLLPDGDRRRQVDVRVSLASAQRALGELERCHATLLDASGLLPADAVARRVELTTLCASVEHWLGRHGDAHRRLVQAWDELPDRSTAAGAALQIELTVDGLYELDFEQAAEMGRGALETARTVGDRALIAAAASALCLCETAAGRIADARERLEEARAEVDRLTDAELAPRLEALYYLGWAEAYLERYDDCVARFDRGVTLARERGDGRLLVLMMLGKNFSFEMQGRLAEATELCDAALEAARLSASPHELFRALFELGWTRYYAGDLNGALAVLEESARVDPRLAGGTIPNAGGGPGWGLGVVHLELGEVERARRILLELVDEDDLARTMPVERCFDWETLALVELAAGNAEAADGYARRADEDAQRLGLQLPAALASRTRAAVLLAAGDAVEAAAAAGRSAEQAAAIGARLQAAFSRSLQGRALVAAGERPEAIRVLREAEAELDACGSVRVRDEMRRELRKLGARAESRGPASGESGIASLSKRELEIAELATDRKTNREIAAALFLSDKTVESHLRNIFNKLGVSSRVEVARAVERDRREREATKA